jgi:hypothetical protein
LQEDYDATPARPRRAHLASRPVRHVHMLPAHGPVAPPPTEPPIGAAPAGGAHRSLAAGPGGLIASTAAGPAPVSLVLTGISVAAIRRTPPAWGPADATHSAGSQPRTRQENPGAALRAAVPGR